MPPAYLASLRFLSALCVSALSLLFLFSRSAAPVRNSPVTKSHDLYAKLPSLPFHTA